MNLKKILVYIFGFILIYQPNYPIELISIKLNNHLLLIFFTIIYLIVYTIKRKNIFKFFKNKNIFLYTFLLIYSTIYFALRTILAGTEFFDTKNIRIIQNLFPILYLLAALIINNELNELGMSTKEKIKYVINLAIVQSIIAISMLFFPSLKKIAIYIFSQESENINIYIAKNRLHGICDGDYTYSFQILHGIISLICLIYAFVYNEKKYYIYTILILLVTFLNGRSGIIIFIVGIVIFLFIIFFHSHKLSKLVKFIAIMIIMIFTVYKIISLYIPSAESLIRHAILDVIKFNAGNEDTETSQLYNMMKFPNGIEFLVGKGYRVYGQKGLPYGETFYSDIGIVNEIYMGGIFYSILLYSAYFKLYKNKNKNIFEFSIKIIMFSSIILANIKGEVFRSSLLQTIIIFIAIILLFDNSKYSNKEMGM